VNLEIALSGVSAKVKPSQPVFRWLKVRRDVGWRNQMLLRDPRTLSRPFRKKLSFA